MLYSQADTVLDQDGQFEVNVSRERPANAQNWIPLYNEDFPLHSHQMKSQRPNPYPARHLYVYYPGTSRIDNEAAVNVRMRH